MSKMVENVARAIAFNDPSCKRDVNQGLVWPKPIHFEQARAAILAMSEPTEEMKECHEDVHWGYNCHVCGGLEDGWRKMFSAALDNKPQESSSHPTAPISPGIDQ